MSSNDDRSSGRATLWVVVVSFVALISSNNQAAAQAQPRRLKACVVSLNEPHEVEAFKKNLDPRKFEIIDIRGSARPPTPSSPAAQRSWLLDACTPETSCDIAVYSAEFAGHFFGKSGASLSLQEMEEASCQPRCAGLFHKPLEVFLLACNTLATKDEDARTPEEYLEVLLEHGFDRAAAERVVELRYGPLGPSFRESLRRVFAGVPRIYGFSSVAPRGEYTAPMLTRYLRGKRDYAATLVQTARATSRNHVLLSNFRGTSMTQTTGLTRKEPGAIDRGHICTLYDENVSVAERLRTSYGLLVRPDALRFVPTVEVFLSRHPSDGFSPTERAIFTAIQNLDATRHDVLQLVRKLNVSALKLELAHFAVLVGWLHETEFHTLAVDSARELLHQRLSAEVVDIMCAITKNESLRDDFRREDIDPAIYDDTQGLRLLSCLAPSDPRVTPRVAEEMRSADPAHREWTAYTLAQLHPPTEAVLVRLVPYLRDPSPAVSGRVRWLFQTQQRLPTGVKRQLERVDPALLRERAARERPDSRFASLFDW